MENIFDFEVSDIKSYEQTNSFPSAEKISYLDNLLYVVFAHNLRGVVVKEGKAQEITKYNLRKTRRESA